MTDVQDQGTATSNGQPGWLQDPDVMVFSGEQALPLGSVEKHRLHGAIGELFGKPKAQVEADWNKVIEQMNSLLSSVALPAKDYRLEQVTFELGFSATGQVVFIAQAGVTASISVTFKRADPPG